ncbi:MAG TPA: hypothetical protein VFF67_00940 [Thermoplasmata archaeon]|nr:hypothetical protein [Thermoplasmata archaeon]
MFIQPDGNARIVSEEELRVVTGRLDHMEFNHPNVPRQFIVWTTVAGQTSKVSAVNAPSRLSIDRIDFASPLTARDSAWQRVCVSAEWNDWFRMAQPSTARGQSATTQLQTEYQSIEIASLGRRFERRLTPDATIRLQVILPDRYPVRGARYHVRFHSETDRVDPIEEKRLGQLARDDWRQAGLRDFGSTFTLTVPRPLLDRHYAIGWDLPTIEQRRAWLAELRRTLVR